MIEMAEKTIDFGPAELVYNIGRPGMPKKAVLPTAAPDQDGAAVDLNAVVFVGVTLRLKFRVDPSDRGIAKFCPAAERAVVSLYVSKFSQQYVSQPAGAVPCVVAGAQLCACTGFAANPHSRIAAATAQKSDLKRRAWPNIRGFHSKLWLTKCFLQILRTRKLEGRR